MVRNFVTAFMPQAALPAELENINGIKFKSRANK